MSTILSILAREIKFRAWDGREMFQVAQITIARGGWSFEPEWPPVEGEGRRGVSIPAQPHVVLMQFTGLRDADGEEIYEGDIVVIHDKYIWFDNGKPNYRGTVEWMYSQWQVVAHCVNSDKRGISDGINEGLNDDGLEDGEKSQWCVIGNRWENPELLK